MKKSKGFLYILPSLLILITFQMYPVIKVLIMSFYTKFDYIKDIVYERGFDNYLYVLTDGDFYIALRNTFTYVAITVPLSIGLAIFIATLLNQNLKLKNFFRSAYFLPFVTSTVAISVGWRWIFNSDQGLVNLVLNTLGFASKQFLKSPEYTMPLLILLNIWKSLGYNVVIILAGLQNIDDRYYYAARVDGAGKWNIFREITLPLLSPIVLFLSITSIIRGFKLFDEIFVLYDKSPGPLKSGMTIVYYIFNKFYMNWQFAVASAAAFILFIIILIFTLVQFKIAKKKVHY
ncbi:carbohydrate ABC transporter permease [Clostridium algidicarnis]|uniref:carbohydrate ABC transporter permease n=1 Tax=Clostridium algidicarnis TaxID=37659 RepID=UPI001C0E853F|nr:sugar ABC transporter permease [Clostridium algidicarnis]MBU3203710.1 sugar ABC transporter permease [Clostridium algidicarnis]MBU3211864.1 sugar ABC transporter permease [Clostridium algidicarnis]MBU3221630.1 sugar ABC transporter permease [Clostridium algidicarnis]